MNNYIPSYGKIVIVDNVADEVAVLQSALSQVAAPYVFIDYGKNLEIERKISGVRLIFLDISLSEGAVGDTTTYSILTNVLEGIVGKHNGPYAVVFWTTNIAEKDGAEEYIRKNLPVVNSTLPSVFISLDKKDYLYGEPQDCIKKLRKSLDENLKDQNMLNFLVEWERIAMESPEKTVSALMYETKTQGTNAAMEEMLFSIANIVSNGVDQKSVATRNVLETLGELMLNNYTKTIADAKTVERLSEYWKLHFADAETAEVQEATEENEPEQCSISLETKAVLNSAFNIDFNSDGKQQMPGRVWILNKEDIPLPMDQFKQAILGKDWSDELTSKSKLLARATCIPVILDITSECDYAQNRLTVHRVVYGYLVSFEIEKDKIDKFRKDIREKMNKCSDANYVSPLIFANNCVSMMLFNSRFICFSNGDCLEKHKYLFGINTNMLRSIKKVVSDYIGRIGISQIDK